MTTVGSVAAIWRFPTKSLRGEALDETGVSLGGLDGDRTSALLVRAGHAREGKAYRGKENDRLHLTGDAAQAVALAAQRGVDAEILRGGRYFDDAPVSVLVDRWLEGLSSHVGYPVEAMRFRPNFFVAAAPGFTLGEDALNGRELRLGTVRLRVRCPIERCVVTTYDPSGAAANDPRVLRYVARERNAWMGVYCDVLEPGRVAVGDAVTLP